MTPRLNRSTVSLPLFLAAALSAQAPSASSALPPDQQVIAYLNETLEWYRQRNLERLIATNATDLQFLNENRSLAVEVTRLSFDFAKADAALSKSSDAVHKQGASDSNVNSPQVQQLLLLQKSTDAGTQKTTQEIQEIQRQLVSAGRKDRRRLEAALAAAQSRAQVLQAGSDTIQQLLTFLRRFGDNQSGSLAYRVEDMARAVPEVMSPGAQPQQPAELPPSPQQVSPGLISLSSAISEERHKRQTLDDAIVRTQRLKQSCEELRAPLVASITKRFEQETSATVESGDLAALQQQRQRLDDLEGAVKAWSPAIVALDKQRFLLEAYESRLKGWRALARAQENRAWKELGLRVTAAATLILALIAIGRVIRRAIRGHVQDIERRHHMLVVARVGVWFIVLLIAIFSSASDFRSLATLIGLLTAGVAVALQSVILCVAGYLVLVGRHGIRLGDKVQISGVCGVVVEISWLQFQLTQIDADSREPTGNIVTFSNSFVFASPAVGLAKLSEPVAKSTTASQ